MVPVRRVVAVTAGLMGAGMVCGAAAGGAAVALVMFLTGGFDFIIEGSVFGAIIGAALGTVAAPLLSWLLLRRVPLGRMFLVCSLATVLGGVVGGLYGASLGCLIAALILHVPPSGHRV